jgi:hypothetical protein
MPHLSAELTLNFPLMRLVMPSLFRLCGIDDWCIA